MARLSLSTLCLNGLFCPYVNGVGSNFICLSVPSLSSRWVARPWLRVGRAVRKGFLPNGFHAMNHDEGEDSAVAVVDADWRRRVAGDAAGDICFVICHFS